MQVCFILWWITTCIAQLMATNITAGRLYHIRFVHVVFCRVKKMFTSHFIFSWRHVEFSFLHFAKFVDSRHYHFVSSFSSRLFFYSPFFFEHHNWDIGQQARFLERQNTFDQKKKKKKRRYHSNPLFNLVKDGNPTGWTL